MNRFLAICWKEFVQLKRDRVTVFIMAGLPVLQLLFFGYAINTDVRNIPTVVYDQDGSAESRDLVQRLEVTGFYDIVGHVRNYDEISRALRSGRARVAIIVPVSGATNTSRSWYIADDHEAPMLKPSSFGCQFSSRLKVKCESTAANHTSTGSANCRTVMISTVLHARRAR